jgi:hypothetical protein
MVASGFVCCRQISDERAWQRTHDATETLLGDLGSASL